MRSKFLEMAESRCCRQNGIPDEMAEKEADQKAKDYMHAVQEKRRSATKILQNNLQFVNADGHPLEFIPLLHLDPELLVQPLYH